MVHDSTSNYRCEIDFSADVVRFCRCIEKRAFVSERRLVSSVTAELLTAIASVGSLTVISATAIAGFVQLRHLRASNQIETLNEFRDAFESPAIQSFAQAKLVVRERLAEPEARASLEGVITDWVRPVMPTLRLFEILGVYVRQGIVSERIVCDMWSPVIISHWDELEPLIVVMRRTRGNSLFENFEMITYFSKRWLAKKTSTYPKNVPRIATKDPWAAIDAVRD